MVAGADGNLERLTRKFEHFQVFSLSFSVNCFDIWIQDTVMQSSREGFGQFFNVNEFVY